MLIRSLAPIIAALMLAGIAVNIPDSASTTQGLPDGISPLGSATTTEETPRKEETKPKPEKKLSEKEKLTKAGGVLLSAVVNVYCEAAPGAPYRGVSGSGVIMDSRGLILTATHVSQLFLLEDYPKKGSASCVIRTGGPAKDTYTAEVVYISSAWIQKNSSSLRQMNPKGNGQHDFAVLAITGTTNGTPLPVSFPALPLSKKAAEVGDRVAIGGYAAQYLGTEQLRTMLHPTIVFDPISEVFTFGNNNVDVISIQGTAAAQEGASGGAVVNADAEIVGVITTSATSGQIKDHELNAVTPFHIRSSFKAETGVDFDTYFSSPLLTLIAQFTTKAALLQATLVKAL